MEPVNGPREFIRKDDNTYEMSGGNYLLERIQDGSWRVYRRCMGLLDYVGFEPTREGAEEMARDDFPKHF